MKKKTNLEKNSPLTTSGKSRKAFRIYTTIVLAVLMVSTCTVTAFAAGDPMATVNKLSDFIFGLIKAVGFIIAGWGVVQLGLSTQSHDPSQRSNGVLTLVGGLIVAFAKEILDLIMG